MSDADLIRYVVARPGDFSSNLVALLHRGPDGLVRQFPLAPYGDPTHVLAIVDPPDHTIQRRLLQPHLSGAAVRRYEVQLRGAFDRLLDPLLAAGGGDAVSLICDPFPAMAWCLLTGVPEADCAASIVAMVSRTTLLLDGGDRRRRHDGRCPGRSRTHGLRVGAPSGGSGATHTTTRI